MCGIAGLVGAAGNPHKTVTEMVSALTHRGPDDNGIWVDSEHNIAFGHARLSIMDLSSSGNQPMISKCGSYVIAFNGEIYNHMSLRQELERSSLIHWRGRSDTETLIECVSAWGVEATLPKLIGMFAFAILDTNTSLIYLARDRAGEKPLYYGLFGEKFIFSSELKAFKAIPDCDLSIDHHALGLFLRYNSIPAPYSIFSGVKKVLPASYLIFNLASKQVETTIYWSFPDRVIYAASNRFTGSRGDAADELNNLLDSAISMQMEADVPLGAFLSGGIDSSVVSAVMQSLSSKPINTFSIGFNDQQFNEAEHARAVAKHIQSNHHDLYVSEQQILDVVPNLSHIYDEPFADSSQIPTYLVSTIAKENVTVALSGDAGDELFGGYNRYIFTKKVWLYLSKLPFPIRTQLQHLILSLPPHVVSKAVSFLFGGKYAQVGDKLHKGASLFGSPSMQKLYLNLISQIDAPHEWLANTEGYEPTLSMFELNADITDIEKMMAQDFVGYLPTDILAKVDRAAMAVSLETRVPFLDPRIIDFALSLPEDYKINDGVGKVVLRDVLYRYVPRHLIERPKMGFGVPLARWLRGPLKGWAEDLLNEQQLQEDGFFNAQVVRLKWNEHLKGKRNWHHQLWNVLMFQAWFKEFKK